MTAAPQPTVFVVDDDASSRRSLANLLRSAGFEVEVFGTAQAYLEAPQPDTPGCLVLDVRLPGMSGLDLQREMARSRAPRPIVFITGHGDIPMAVQAIKGGAVDFLAKPFREQDLLDAIRRAVELDGHMRHARADLATLQHRFDSLSPREREVFERVVAGLPNKQIAAELDLSEATVKVHRGQVMQKMQAESVAELVNMSASLISPARRHPLHRLS
ncbi:MAG: response regulator transcription factor [Acidobacteria bacterium]|nr:response regulator transcription factor [Acidobacteriota bacterium]